MSPTLDEQITQLRQTIAEMEAQRAILGDAAVDAALVPFRQKLVDLEAQAEPTFEEPREMPTRQRKLVTLLFIDVVGSTAMTQHLDPEDTLEIMDDALRRLSQGMAVMSPALWVMASKQSLATHLLGRTTLNRPSVLDWKSSKSLGPWPRSFNQIGRLRVSVSASASTQDWLL
jgi:hypothetical protein